MSTTLEETLERAYRHVSDGWLPPQAEVLEKLKRRLEAGDYDQHLDELHKDLKEDFALYVYCLRELAQMIEPNAEGPAKNARRTPSEIFNSSTIEDFRRILDAKDQDISKHSIQEMTEFQALRFKESMLSASTAEILSETMKVDPDTGFSCALLRQLGLSLIAWNYPRVYARAIERLDANTTLDAALRRVLGFTPSLLGMRFVERWNLSEEFKLALSDLSPRRAASKNLGSTLAKICEVGEALARANDPDHYPTAMDDWEHAQEEIVRYLGPDGVRKIYERAQDHLKHYAKNAPELISFAETDSLKERIAGCQHSSKLLEKNVYLRSLPEDLRAEIKHLYARFRPGKILKTNIETFVRDIIPKAGFCRGVIFMYDPEKRTLAPAVRIGNVTKERLQPVKVFSVLAQYDLLASAFSLKTPLREEAVAEDGNPVVAIAAAVGQITPVGVLYLETTSDFTEKFGDDPMPLFRALRQTLCDCLNVS